MSYIRLPVPTKRTMPEAFSTVCLCFQGFLSVFDQTDLHGFGPMFPCPGQDTEVYIRKHWIYNHIPFADGGLCRHVPTLPGCTRPRIRFLFVIPPFWFGIGHSFQSLRPLGHLAFSAVPIFQTPVAAVSRAYWAKRRASRPVTCLMSLVIALAWSSRK